MVRLVLMMILLTSIAGCRHENSAFCAANPGQQGCPGDASNGGACIGSNDCKDDKFPLCDLTFNNGTCVSCTTDDTHLCQGMLCVSDQCVPCTKHADCTGSNVCLPNGACAVSDSVAYVDGDNGSDQAPCTMTMPCTKIDKAAGIKDIVKVKGTVKNRCSLNNKTVTIVAEAGAKIIPASSGPADNGVVFEVKGSSNVRVYDLEISNAMGGSSSNATVSETANLELTRVILQNAIGNGVLLTGGHLTCSQCIIMGNGLRGIDASGSGIITVTRTKIHDNVNGGIRIADNVAFQIVSNMIFHNGQTDKASAGGININVNAKMAGDLPNQLDFNSINRNLSNGLPQGVSCSSGSDFTASNNTIYNNNGLNIQVNTDLPSKCSWTFSDIGPNAIGGANIDVPPLFMDEANGELHLQAASLVRGMANPNATLTGLAAKDFDGESRVTPLDIGADQYYPPPKASAQ